MNIIIPMTGFGSRFKDYREYKPFITVDNKCVLDYVINSFSQKDNFIFIIRSSIENRFLDFIKNHNINYDYICIDNKNFIKNGPVGTIKYVQDQLLTILNPNQPVIVSYCDFGVKWDYYKFLNDCKDVDGAIACYTGYHPHLLPKNNIYAACMCEKNIVNRVHEKYMSKNKESEHWSCGIYYFKSFDIMSKAFNNLIKDKDDINGEFYVSLAYNYIPGKVLALDCIERFYQLGTPSDLEYVKSKINLNKLNNFKTHINNCVILSAGNGIRFKNEYRQPKPFLPLCNSTLIEEIDSSINANKIFIASEKHKEYWTNIKNIECVEYIEENNLGGAYSYLRAMSSFSGSTLIVPCDLIAEYEISESDAIVYCAEPNDYQLKNPNQFSWISDDGYISIKKKLEKTKYVLIGSFYIKDNTRLISVIENMIENNIHINGEYILDIAFKHLNAKPILVKKYLSFGTPEEYKESKYWYEN